MDATTGLAASHKTIDAVRVAPTWLLVALFFIALTTWLLPAYRAAVPTDAIPWLPWIVGTFGILAACRIVAELCERRATAHARLLTQECEKLAHLYKPLAMLFLTRHLTSATGISAPRLRHRLKNAWDELGAYQRQIVGVKKAWRALFDRMISTSAEIEYGGSFPMTQILDLAEKHSKFADDDLLQLIRHAHRSRYEDYDRNLLTDDEFALFEYIQREYDRLLKCVPR